MRLIDADELKKAFEHATYGNTAVLVFDDHRIGYVNQVIDNAPTEFDDKAYSQGYAQGTIDTEHALERPHGKWIEFAEFVAKEVCTDDFKDNADSFAELACRRLVKLGLLKLDGDTYKNCGAEMQTREDNYKIDTL